MKFKVLSRRRGYRPDRGTYWRHLPDIVGVPHAAEQLFDLEYQCTGLRTVWGIR